MEPMGDPIIMTMGSVVISLILLVWVTLLSIKLKKLNKSYRKIVGDSGLSNLDEIMNTVHEQLKQAQNEQASHAEKIENHQQRLKQLKGHVALERYKAFTESGSDLSFSVAILDDEQDGLVITGIHGREQTFLYAKPVEKGSSAYTLTPEEEHVISKSMKKEE